jgi:hypothetical protein
MSKVLTIGVACAMLLCAACSTTRKAANFNGLSTPNGKPICHLNTSNMAIHLLGSQPLIGNASLEGTVDAFTKAAKEENAAKVNIVQSNVSTWWLILPPFSIVLTPVTSNVAGDALP